MNVANFSVYSAEDNPHLLQPDPKAVKTKPHKSHKKRNWLIAFFAILLIFFTPWRINILLLGIDPTQNETFQGRSDTMILASIPPVLPYVHMLSIPRDLWVEIPGHWQNRINTAHFFAEVEEEGTGPDAAATVVAQSFGVAKPYVVRIKTDGFKSVVDAMGGVTVFLPTDMSGLEAGEHEMDATQALRFVRDRSGSDDFFRQGRAQIFLKGAMKKMFNPVNWWRIPGMIKAINSSITSNVPVVYYPRVAYTLLFSYFKGFDMQILDRTTMVTPWVTNEGAQVLLPVWDNINPLIQKNYK